MPIINNFGGIDKEIYNIGDILHKVGKNYLKALPIVCNKNGEDFEDYRIYGAAGGVGDDSGTEYGYEIDISVGGWSPIREQVGTYINVNTGGTISAGTYSTAFFTAPAEGSVEISIVDNYGTGRLLVYMPYDVGGTALTAYGKQEVYSGRGAHTMTVTVPSGAATIGVSHLNSDTDKGIKTTTPIYIGSDPLGEDEYVDYNSGKIYKYKQVHSDTVTIDGIEWDILGYDHDTVYKSDNTLARHSVTIQAHDVLSDMQFDAKEALFAFDDGLAAGTYHFTVGAQPWYSGDVNKTIQFTLAQALPAGGQLVINNAYNATMVGATISAFASDTTTVTETVTMSEGNDGIDLGTVNNAGNFASGINSIQRALLGSNRWSTSAIRQYLNSDAAASEVWTPQTAFDRPPLWVANTKGFLNGVDADFIAALGTVQKVTALNAVCDGGGTETISEKVFLLSRSEVYAGDEVTGGEGAPYPYYSEYSDLPSAGTGEDGNRIKYRNGAAKYFWLRSPNVDTAHNAHVVSTTGTFSSITAAYSSGVAPACCIPLDDIGKNDWLREKFLKPVDPPVPFPSIPTINGKTTVNYAGEGTEPEKTWFSGMEFEIEDVYFGDKHIFSVWGEYDGILPAQFNANGENLVQYQIYGNTGGVGDETDISNYADIDTGNTYYTDGSNFALPPEAEGASSLSWFFEPSIDYAASENVWRIRGNFRDGTYAYAFYPPSPSFSNTWEISPNNPIDSVTIRKRAITAGSIKVILTKNGAEPGYEVDMGVMSANLLDTTTMMVGQWIEPNGIISSNNLGAVSQQIAIVSGKSYIYYYAGLQPYNMRINECDINGEVLRILNRDETHKITFTASPNAAYIVAGVSKIEGITQKDVESYNLEICEGSTSLPYQPYSKTVTPIYIGSSPLGEDEYVDYGEGKIYRWSNNQLSVPEVREKTNEEITCTVSNDGVYTLTVSDTVQNDRNLSFSYNPVEIPDGKTWVLAASAENILNNNGSITLGDAIHPVISVNIQNNGYNATRPFGPSGTTYILDRMAITVRAGTPVGTFTLRPMLMYRESTDPPVPLPALPTTNGTNIVDYVG